MKEQLITKENFRLHTIFSNKYKRCSIQIILRDKFDKNNFTNLSALLPLIFRGTKEYPSLKELNKHKEYMYGLLVGGYNNVRGNVLSTYICADFISPKYVDEKSYLEEIIKFIFDYIKEPLLSEKDFELIKEELKLSLKKKMENIGSKAFSNSRKTLECNLAYPAFDTEEDIDNLNLKDIKESLNYLINNTVVDIYVFGNLDMNNIEELINKYCIFKGNNIELDFYDFIHHRDVVELENKDNFEQSFIHYIYSLEDVSKKEHYYVAAVLSDILGGGLNSILYKDIREKHSLCYSLSARYDRNYNILDIAVGVDKSNIDKTKERIEYIMSNLDTLIKNNNVEDVKLNIVNGILSSTDDIDYLILEADRLFTKTFDPTNVKIEEFKKVTLDDIKSIIPKIKIYTKYVLVGDKNERN